MDLAFVADLDFPFIFAAPEIGGLEDFLLTLFVILMVFCREDPPDDLKLEGSSKERRIVQAASVWLAANAT